jgi:hypothetical protein
VQRQVVGGDFNGHVVGHVLFSLSLDVGQPVVVLGGAAINHVEILGLDLGSDRSAMADADLAAVEFANRRHFGGGAGEESFVGAIHFVAGDALFDAPQCPVRRRSAAPWRG